MMNTPNNLYILDAVLFKFMLLEIWYIIHLNTQPNFQFKLTNFELVCHVWCPEKKLGFFSESEKYPDVHDLHSVIVGTGFFSESKKIPDISNFHLVIIETLLFNVPVRQGCFPVGIILEADSTLHICQFSPC
jgi:hypothetical protein